MKRLFPTSLALLLVMASLGHVLAAAFCPRALGHECCFAKTAHHPHRSSSGHENMAVHDMNMDGMSMDSMNMDGMNMDGMNMDDMAMADKSMDHMAMNNMGINEPPLICPFRFPHPLLVGKL